MENKFTYYEHVDPFSTLGLLNNFITIEDLDKITNSSPTTRFDYIQNAVKEKNNSTSTTRSTTQSTNSPWFLNYNIRVDLTTNNTQPTSGQYTFNTPRSYQTSTDSLSTAYNYFIDKGLTPWLAAGIVGNLAHESSGGHTDILEGGKHGELTSITGRGYGLAQWTSRNRLLGLIEFAKSRGTKTSDLLTQLDYLWKELNTSEKRSLEELRKTKTIEEATESFMNNFERPNKQKAQLNKRLNYAKKYLT